VLIEPFALYSTALLIQLLLSLDRRDIAQTTYQSAKQWGEDSLLIQIMEAWIGMKTVSVTVLFVIDMQLTFDGLLAYFRADDLSTNHTTYTRSSTNNHLDEHLLSWLRTQHPIYFSDTSRRPKPIFWRPSRGQTERKTLRS
jgi:hypothetical protein